MKKFITSSLKFACIISFLTLTSSGLYFIAYFVLKGELHKPSEFWFYTFSAAFWVTAIALHLVSYQKSDKKPASLLSGS